MADPEPKAPDIDLKDVSFILRTLATCSVPMKDVEQAYRTALKLQVLHEYLSAKATRKEA